MHENMLTLAGGGVGRDAVPLRAQVRAHRLGRESRRTSSGTSCLSFAQFKALRVSLVLRTNLLLLRYLLES